MNFNVGDKVIIDYGYRGYAIGTVEKITPSGFIKVDGILFNQNGSLRTSDIYNRTSITLLTPELKEKLKEEKIVNEAYKLLKNVSNLNYEKAKQIIEILKD